MDFRFAVDLRLAVDFFAVDFRFAVDLRLAAGFLEPTFIGLPIADSFLPNASDWMAATPTVA